MTKNMKIAIYPKKIAMVFNHSAIIGGGEISFLHLVRTITKGAYSLVVYVPGRGEISEKLKSEGLSVKVIDLPRIRTIKFWRVLNAEFRLYKQLSADKIDLMHVNGSRACIYCVVAGLLRRRPVIWHVRETKQDLRLIDGMLTRFCSRIICVSKAVLEKRLAAYKVQIQNKTDIVYNGVDPDIFCPSQQNRELTRKQLGVTNECLFGIIGNFTSLKGQHEFVQALALVLRQPSGLKMKALLVGKSNDVIYREHLEQLVETLGLSNVIVFKDFTNVIVPYYQALDVFVLPSRREGFSRALIEAMAVGLPVIASRIDEIAEAVVDGENAILVDPANHEEFSKAIVTLACDPERRRQMGVSNREKVSTQFTLARHTSQIMKIYNQIFEKRDQRGRDI